MITTHTTSTTNVDGSISMTLFCDVDPRYSAYFTGDDSHGTSPAEAAIIVGHQQVVYLDGTFSIMSFEEAFSASLTDPDYVCMIDASVVSDAIRRVLN